MFVYFIIAGGYVKIGKAVNPQARLKELQVGCPFAMHIYETIDCGTSKGALHHERHLHKMFKKQRMRGEWFQWNKAMRAYIAHSKRDMERDALLAAQYDAFQYAQYLAALDRAA